MIKINELRVDNWVYNSYTKQNIQVYPMMIPQLHRLEKENGSLKDCNIDPIPLTEEILLKCGFRDVSSYKDYWLTVEDDLTIEISVRRNEMCFTCVSDVGLLCDVKYVHQLQNLYFAISGKELKIEL